MPSTNELLLRVLKEQNDLRSAMRRVVGNLPLYDIDNENTPALLTVDQNNYVPGNYDVLRLTSSAEYSITGIAAGVKGRKLRIFNVGDYGITLVHQSGSSLAANRFAFVNESDFIIPPNGNVLLYYDWTTTKWIGGDQASIYDVVNESTPAQITSNQNDYAPGLSEVLRLSTDASRTITGISGGVKGRYLQIINVGNFNITLPYESALSSAPNRFITPSAENTVLYPRASVRLYYDGVLLRWSIPDAPTWKGTYGVSLLISNSSAKSVNGPTKLTFDTVSIDQWSMWNNATQKIVIPSSGLYYGVLMGTFDSDGVGGNWQAVSWDDGGGGGTLNGQTAHSDAISSTSFSCPIGRYFSAGDTLEVYANQSSGSPINFDAYSLFFARIL